MDSIIKQVINEYGWNLSYAKNVFDEYERFMVLRYIGEKIGEKISPSDDIDKFWHQHILNTKNYMTYCNTKFERCIHHDPEDAHDKNARQIRLNNTIKEYALKFGPFINKNVWIKKQDNVINMSKIESQNKSENKSENKSINLLKQYEFFGEIHPSQKVTVIVKVVRNKDTFDKNLLEKKFFRILKNIIQLNVIKMIQSTKLNKSL